MASFACWNVVLLGGQPAELRLTDDALALIPDLVGVPAQHIQLGALRSWGYEETTELVTLHTKASADPVIFRAASGSASQVCEAIGQRCVMHPAAAADAAGAAGADAAGADAAAASWSVTLGTEPAELRLSGEALALLVGPEVVRGVPLRELRSWDYEGATELITLRMWSQPGTLSFRAVAFLEICEAIGAASLAAARRQTAQSSPQISSTDRHFPGRYNGQLAVLCVVDAGIKLMVGSELVRYCAFTEIRSWCDDANSGALSITTKDYRVLTLSCDHASEACEAMADTCLVVARAMQLSAAHVSAAALNVHPSPKRSLPEGIPEPEQRFERGVRNVIDEEDEAEDEAEDDTELARIALAQQQQDEAEEQERTRQEKEQEAAAAAAELARVAMEQKESYEAQADELRRSVAAAKAAAASVADESARQQAAAEQLAVEERQRAEQTARDAAAAAEAQAAAVQAAMTEAVERAAEQAKQAAEAASKAQIEAMEEKYRTLLAEQTASAAAGSAAAPPVAAAPAPVPVAAPAAAPVLEPVTPPHQLQSQADQAVSSTVVVTTRLPPLNRDQPATAPPSETWPVAPKPLRSAIRSGALAVVQQHVVGEANANSLMSKHSGKVGTGLLYAAAQRGHVGIVQHLLVQRADPNAASASGSTPLYTAVFNGHDAVVQILLDAGANPHAPKGDGWTPLTLASSQENGGERGQMVALLEGRTHGGGGSSSGPDSGGSTDDDDEQPATQRRERSSSPVSRSWAAGADGDSLNSPSRSAAIIANTTALLSLELESLANLRREGLLSEVEFSQAKAAIINSSLGGTPIAQLRAAAAASPTFNSTAASKELQEEEGKEGEKEEAPSVTMMPSVMIDYEQVMRSVSSSQAADAAAMQLEVATAEHRITLASAQRSAAEAFKTGRMEDALTHFATAIAGIREVMIISQEICGDQSDPESGREMDPLAMRSVLLDVLEVRAIASYNLGDFGGALRDATHCITLDGRRLAGYLRAARSLQKLGRVEEAKGYMLAATENAETEHGPDQSGSALD